MYIPTTQNLKHMVLIRNYSKDLHAQNVKLQQDEIIKKKAEEKSPGNNEKKATPNTGAK